MTDGLKALAFDWIVFNDQQVFARHGNTSTLALPLLRKRARFYFCAVNGTIPTMKSQDEVESAVGESVSIFELKYLGRRPRAVRAHLINDAIVVRLQGVLALAEQQMVKTVPARRGIGLLKEMRSQLIETMRPALETMIQEITGVKVVSLHHDVSTVTGEEVIVFTLAESPCTAHGQYADFR